MYLEIGSFQLRKWREELCGDSVQISRAGDTLVMVLSDGLGSGVKANILSTLTSKIIVTMLFGGASLADVVETVSQTLPVCRERHLAYSTFTVARVDSGGRAQLAEFDNPPVIFVRNGKRQDYQFQEYQLAGKRIRESQLILAEGDYLIMLSDGIVHAGAGGILNFGWQWQEVANYAERLCAAGNQAQDVASWIGMASEQLYEGKPGDDATVLVLQGRKSRSVTIAVGPPLRSEDDPRLAKTLAAASGKKVICGGTTSQIIAREWGERLEVDLKAQADNLPPTGKLNGADLITEGVITLAQAKQLLANGENTDNLDGASRLVEILKKSDEITFLVGRAINPAHQNPNFPLNLGLKSQLVRELAQQLEKMDKAVTVHYF